MTAALTLATLLTALATARPTPAPAPSVTVTTLQLDNGMRVVLGQQNSSNPLPLLTLVLRSQQGGLHDPAGRAGLAALALSALIHGPMAGQEVSHQRWIEDVGGTLQGHVTHDAAYVTLQVHSRDLARALNLLTSLARGSALTAPQLKASRASLLRVTRERESQAAQRAVSTLLQLIYAEHPLGLPAQGSTATLAKVTHEDVQAWRQQAFGGKRQALALLGQIDASTALSALGDTVGLLPAGTPLPEPPTPLPAGGGDNIVLVDTEDMTRAAIALGHLGISQAHPDAIAAELVACILARRGASSRVIDVLGPRDAGGRSAEARFQVHAVNGPFVVTLQTTPDAASQSTQRVLAAIERLARSGVSPQELRQARAALRNRWQRRRLNEQLSAIDLLELAPGPDGQDPWQHRLTLLDQVKPAATARAARTLISPAALRVVLVGPTALLEPGLDTLRRRQSRPTYR